MNGRILWAAFMALALAIPGSDLGAQTPYTPGEPQQPPTIIVPPKPAPTLQPPAGTVRPAESSATFCCTAYGRFGPVGSGAPGGPCQWTLPSGVAQGSTCN
jgi:hypothetical protein